MNKNYKLLVPFFAVALLLLATGLSSAASTITRVDFDGITVYDTTGMNYVKATTGSTIPVSVWFSVDAPYDDMKIKVELTSTSEEVSEKEYLYDVVNGSTNRVNLNLEMPSELDDLSDELTLQVTIYGDGHELTEDTYDLRMQRESYEVSVLSVDYNTKVSSGDVVPVTVVLKNTGYRDLDDAYVIVSIPALGISTRAYVDDLYSVDEKGYNDDDDSAEKTVFLQIPANAETGVYELVVEAYNDDTETVQKSVIAIDGVTTSDDGKTLTSDNGNSNSIIALTIVLAVVFVALLVVLIVLITKKDKTFEEVETSYY